MTVTAKRDRFNASMLVCGFLGIASVLHTGCSPATNSMDMKAMRDSILVSSQPQDLISLAKSYEEVEAENVSAETVTIVGRIYASGMSPFEAESASFSVIELPKPGHNHDDPGDCPFCKRELENAATAVVQVVDSDGEPIGVSAEELLGLERNDDIVATGTVEMVGELMIVNATQIHVLTEDAATELATKFAAAPSTGASDDESTVFAPPALPPQMPDPLLDVDTSVSDAADDGGAETSSSESSDAESEDEG